MDPETTGGRAPLDLNTASAQELEALAGIGPVLAERIIADRAAAGPYRRVEDVLRVSGLGPRLLERLRPYVTVRPPASPPEQAPSPWDEAGLPASASDEPALPAHDEAALDEELHAYEELEIPEEELYWEPETEEPLAAWDAQAPEELPAAEPGVAAAPPEQPRQPPDEVAPEPETASPVARTATAQTATPQPAQGGYRRGWLLVLLGGLLGALFTLLTFAIVSGTLDYAPRRLVVALSRNMDIMQANQELAWQRLTEVIVTANDLERRVARLEGLAARVAELEEQAATNAQQLAELESSLRALEADLTSFEEESRRLYAGLEERVADAELELEALGTLVANMQETVSELRERVSRYDSFVRALRELLLDLDKEPAPVEEQGS